MSCFCYTIDPEKEEVDRGGGGTQVVAFLEADGTGSASRPPVQPVAIRLRRALPPLRGAEAEYIRSHCHYVVIFNIEWQRIVSIDGNGGGRCGRARITVEEEEGRERRGTGQEGGRGGTQREREGGGQV